MSDQKARPFEGKNGLDIGIACVGLATNGAKLITGATKYIDGGLHIMG